MGAEVDNGLASEHYLAPLRIPLCIMVFEISCASFSLSLLRIVVESISLMPSQSLPRLDEAEMAANLGPDSHIHCGGDCAMVWTRSGGR